MYSKAHQKGKTFLRSKFLKKIILKSYIKTTLLTTHFYQFKKFAKQPIMVAFLMEIIYIFIKEGLL